MRIDLTSILVDDQEKALKFYTEKLGFKKMADVPVGEYRWLTVISPEGSSGTELVLEPTGFPPAYEYQKALFTAGIPFTAFRTEDLDAEYTRLKKKGVIFRGEPVEAGLIKTVLFEDTCGNLINLVQAMMKPDE